MLCAAAAIVLSSKALGSPSGPVSALLGPAAGVALAAPMGLTHTPWAAWYHTHLLFSIFQVVVEGTVIGRSVPATLNIFEMVPVTVALVKLSVNLTSSIWKPLIRSLPMEKYVSLVS